MIRLLIMPLFVRIVRTIARKASPEIRGEVIAFVKNWEGHCRKTPNKWDDILVDLVKAILSIK